MHAIEGPIFAKYIFDECKDHIYFSNKKMRCTRNGVIFPIFKAKLKHYPSSSRYIQKVSHGHLLRKIYVSIFCSDF